MNFELTSAYKPTGDQPEAIAKLVQGIRDGDHEQTLLGVTGSGKTYTIANVIAQVNKPTLVLAHNKILAAQLCSEFREFFPNNAVEYFVSYYDYYQPEAYIPSTDSYIEKDSSINDEIDKMRHSATAALAERKDVIIVASVSCIYSLGSPEEYRSMMVSIRVGMEKSRDQLIDQLVAIQYERNDINFVRNKFRVRGDVVEIFPASSTDKAIRVEYFGDEIDRICEINVVSGEVTATMQYAAILPASHYVVTVSRCKELDLPHQVSDNTSVLGTPFTVTIDKLEGCTTGVSASDRAATIQALADPTSTPATFGRPGHINPLYAQEKGVLRRAGHTEATIDMARLAGLYPAGALMEIMSEDGTMARLPELRQMADEHGLKLISIHDLIVYRLKQESIVEKGVEVNMPTEHGKFRLIPFRQKSNGLEHMAIFKGTWSEDEPILVRVHSSCATGDILGSQRCDCGEQLHKAMEMIEKEGKGVVVYLNQEGRGIGLMEKMKAYKLQEDGMDTVDANICLGHLADERDYGVGAQILRELGVHKMRLLTNNPVKRVGLEAYGLEIVENVPVETVPNPYNERYLRTKKERMGHTLHFNK